MGDSNIQQVYWHNMQASKIYYYYLNYYAIYDERLEKGVNILLALTSTSSIAAWAIWKQFDILWAIIIASSQVIMAIKPFLPFKQRLNATQNLSIEMNEISLDAEKEWYAVAEGELTGKQIHSKYIEVQKTMLSAEKKCLDKVLLPKKEKLFKMAVDEADTYFRSRYFNGET